MEKASSRCKKFVDFLWNALKLSAIAEFGLIQTLSLTFSQKSWLICLKLTVLARIRMVAEPAAVSLVCVCVLYQAWWCVFCSARGLCRYARKWFLYIRAPKKCKQARTFTCVKMRRSCTPADYIYILDVVLWGVLLYLPDKIEQNMALGIRTVLRSMLLA